MTTQVLASGRFATILISESRAEVLKMIRVPAYILPVLLFPAMFYVLFGILLGTSAGTRDWDAARYLLGSYGAFGVIGAALFGMGVGVAAERGQGWLMLKRATPMPPLAFFAAKAVMSIIIGALITIVLGVLAVTLGGVRLTAGVWVMLLLTLSIGAVPFCALGCLLGYVSGPSSAPAIANLVYLPMSFASGLWLPIEALPDAMQRAAPFLPPYHLGELARGIINGNGSDALTHITALAAFTVLFLAVAVFAYRRDSDRTWG